MAVSSLLVQNVVDYLVFGLSVTIAIVISFLNGRRQNSSEEYFSGSHKMSLFPVSISLFVSYVSALTMQGVPAEVYMHGIGVGMSVLAFWGVLLVIVTFLPIYYHMKPASIFEYLEQRYGAKNSRMVASCIFALCQVLSCGLMIYGPATAMESFSGISTGYMIAVISVVCTVYTTVGGVRGVIWTDVFQAAVIILGFLLVIIMGCQDIGVQGVWQELERNGKTMIELSPDPSIRLSLWTCIVCMGFQWFMLFCLQTSMIRFTSLPSQKQAALSLVIGGCGYVLLICLATAAGAVVFAHYSKLGCGPLASGDIKTSNQVIPHFVVTELRYPGLPGLFIAAIVASTLSTVSSILNATSGLFWNDILLPFLPQLSAKVKVHLMKIIVAAVGVLSMCVAFAAQNTGETLFNLGYLIVDTILSPLFGLFIAGGCFSFVSGHAAIIGCIAACGFCCWISIGKMLYGSAPNVSYVMQDCKPAYFGVSHLTNDSLSTTTKSIAELVTVTDHMSYSRQHLWLYDMSSYVNPTIGLFLSVILACLLSLIPALRHKGKVNYNLLFPLTRQLVKTNPDESKDMKQQKELSKL